MWAAFFSTILFSISAVSGNKTARLLGGTVANFWRLVFATLFLGLFAHLYGNGLRGDALPVFFLSGCIGFGIGDIALFQALPRLGSRLSVMLVSCLSAPIAALIEWLWLGTSLSVAEVICALVILAGVALALSPGHLPTVAPGQLMRGILCGLMAAVCQAVGAVLSRKAFAVAAGAMDNIDGITAAYQRILGGVAITGFCLLAMNRRAIVQGFLGTPSATGSAVSPWRAAWPYVLVNSLAGPTLGVSCFQWALKLHGTGLVLPVVATTPLVIIPFSHYLEGERPSRRSICGGLIAVGGAVCLAWAVSR